MPLKQIISLKKVPNITLTVVSVDPILEVFFFLF